MSLVQKNVLDNWNQTFKVGSTKDYPSLELVRLQIMHFNNTRKGNLLEYACGSGCNTEHLIKLGYNVTALDISIDALNATKLRINKKKINNKNLKIKKIKIGDSKLPFKDDSFEYIVAMSVLSLLGSEKAIKSLLKEFKRVLKPNGKIIIDINDQNSEFSNGFQEIYPNTFKVIQKGKKPFNAYCLKNASDFKKLIKNYFKIDDVGFSAHSIFKRRINEWIISATNS
jgi:ubiquinone/menaquinone biosynthesis C-methylase UbiE